MDYHLLPKTELHLHLDCSLSYDVVKQIDPSVTEEDYRENFIAPPKCTDLVDYIKRAVKGYQLMQTPEQLRLVTLDLFRQLKADNVIYAEIRFAPLLHIEKGMSPYDVVKVVNDAAAEGIRETGIEAGILLATLRHYTEEQSIETVKLAETFKGTHICGFDIAGDEAGYPIRNHIKAYEYAHAHGIPCTAHAGEACGASSVWETLEHFGPTRIGHGVRSAEDDKLLDYLIQKDIHLEVCPTSNVQTNVCNRIEDHPAGRIYRKGVSMSINCDARTVSPVTLTSEYSVMEKVFAWEIAHFKRCNLEAIRHAFTTEIIKEKLRAQIEAAYKS